MAAFRPRPEWGKRDESLSSCPNPTLNSSRRRKKRLFHTPREGGGGSLPLLYNPLSERDGNCSTDWFFYFF